MLTNARGHVSQVLGQTVTAKAPHGSQEGTMSPTKRYAKKQAKARQRRRLKVQERLARGRLQAHTPPRFWSRPSMTWGYLKTSCPRSKAAYGVNSSCWARLLV